MFKNVLTSFPLLLIFIVNMFPCTLMSAEPTEWRWSFTVKDGIEESARTYLLVYEPGTDKERRATVVSRCEKPHQAMETYGKCSHKIGIQPINIDFTLATGEGVVMIQFTWDAPLILATIEDGCCTRPDIVKFYTEKGEYLGFIEGHGVSGKANYGNLITRTFNMDNGTRYGKKIYLLVRSENKENLFHALVFEKDLKANIIPVVLTIPDRQKCESWHIDKFIAYGDRKDITMKLRGIWCSNLEGISEIIFNCSASEKAITCLSEEGEKTKGAVDPPRGRN